MFTWMLYSWTLAPLDLTLDCTQIWTALLFHWKGSLKLLHATYRSLTALTGSQGTIIGSLPSALVPTMLLASPGLIWQLSWVLGHHHRELNSALVPTMLPASLGHIQGIPAHSGSKNWLHKFIGATTAPCSSTGVCVAPCG